METTQKFSTFTALKNDEVTAEQPLFAAEVKHLLELMRQGEIPVKNAE